MALRSEGSPLARTVVAHMIVTLDGVAKFDAVQPAIMELIPEQREDVPPTSLIPG